MGANKTYHDLITEALGRSVSPIERYALEKKLDADLKISTTLQVSRKRTITPNFYIGKELYSHLNNN